MTCRARSDSCRASSTSDFDVRVYPVDQRVPDALGDGQRTPRLVLDGLFLRAAHAVGHFEQSLCRVRAPVEHHVLDGVAQVERDVLIDAQLSGVDDTHVHAGPGGVVEEDGVNRLAHGVVPPE